MGYRCRIYTQGIAILTVNVIMLVLKIKHCKCQLVKIARVGSKNGLLKVNIFNGLFQLLLLNLNNKITIMRYIILIAFAVVFFAACEKNKFNTVPAITFKEFKPDVYNNSTPDEQLPILIINVTDAEGDLGYINGSDTSYIYIKNLRTNREDSAVLPNIKPIATKNFQADISLFMKQYLGSPRATRDTIFFEVYVKDFAKNKSNVIKTDKPVYFIP